MRKLVFLAAMMYAVVIKSLAQPAMSIPDFILFRQDGTEFTKKDFDPDKLLFFLFFDVTCVHCKEATKAINKKYPELDNTVIHLVTLDKPEEVNSFLKKNGKNLVNKKNVHLLFDSNNEFITRFKPKRFPSIFLYTPGQKLLIYKDNPDSLQVVFDQIKNFTEE